MADPLKELLETQVDDSQRRPIWPWVIAGATALVVALVLVFVVGDSEDPSSVEAGSSASSTTMLAATESSLVLDDSVVEQGVAGPAPGEALTGFGGEETLTSVDGLSLVDRRWFEGSTESTVYLDVDRRVAVGAVPGTQYRVLAMFGTVADPYDASFGAPGACYQLSGPESGLIDCFGYDPPGDPRPLFVGTIGSGFTAWGVLPADASVAVLSVNDANIAWQRPRAGTAIFRFEAQPGDQVELRILDASGVELDSVDRQRPGPATGTYVEAITGYGDFSGMSADQIDPLEVNTLIVACMNDQGFGATLLPPGTTVGDRTIDTSTIAERDRTAADLAHAQCRAGLNLPDPNVTSDEALRTDYDAMVAIGECLAGLGYPLGSPPPFHEWAATAPETRWDPIRLMELRYPDEAPEALPACLG